MIHLTRRPIPASDTSPPNKESLPRPGPVMPAVFSLHSRVHQTVSRVQAASPLWSSNPS